MRTLLIFAVSAALAMSTTLASAAQRAEDPCPERLTIRVAKDYAPFSVRTPDGSFAGMDVALIERVMAETDCPYEFITQPWPRALRAVETGELDIVAFASITPERQRFARFSAPYRMERVRLIMRRDDVARYEIETLEDLVAQRLRVGHEMGTYRGDAFAAFLDRYENTSVVQLLNESANGLDMLRIGRIDILVDDRAVAFATAENLGLRSEFAAHPLPLLDAPVHLMVSKASTSPALIDRLDAAIIEVVGRLSDRD